MINFNLLKFKFKTIVIIVLSLFLSSCSKNNKENQKEETDELISTISEADTSYKETIQKKSLRYNLRHGDKFQYKISTKSSSDQLISMDSTTVLNINQKANYIIDFETINILNDTIYEFQVQITKIFAKAWSDKESREFNSEKNFSDTSSSEVFNEYRAILRNPFKSKISNLGQIIDIYSTEKIIKDYLKLIKKEKEATDEDRKIMTQALVDGSLKPLLKNIFKTLPQQEAALDLEWREITQTKMMTFDVKNIARYRIAKLYKSKKYELAAVESNLKATFEGNNIVEQNDLRYIFETPVIKGTGSYIFNFDRGLIMTSKTSSLILTAFKIQSLKSPTFNSKKESLNTETLIELL